jgi:hypothetical protein
MHPCFELKKIFTKIDCCTQLFHWIVCYLNFILLSCCIFKRERSFFDIIHDLSSQVDPDGKKNIVNVDRNYVWESAIRTFSRKTFVDKHMLTVRFSGEDGVDSGGLTREYLRLVFKEIRALSLFTGKENSKLLRFDYKGTNIKNKFNSSICIFFALKLFLCERCM